MSLLTPLVRYRMVALMLGDKSTPPISALGEAAEAGQLASCDPVLLAHLLVGMLMQAMNWWVEQDEPGPDVMADHLLFLLGQGLPSSLLTGERHVPRTGPIEEN